MSILGRDTSQIQFSIAVHVHFVRVADVDGAAFLDADISAVEHRLHHGELGVQLREGAQLYLDAVLVVEFQGNGAGNINYRNIV